MKIPTYALLLALFAACSQPKKELTATEKESYLLVGDSISENVQKVLLQNVARAIKTGGVANAVNFCSEKAFSPTDSLSNHHDKNIQRLSDRNRNTGNGIESDLDKQAWEEIKSLALSSSKAKHLILQENSAVYYYNAISIGMPTCLKCHGDKLVEIDPTALKLINEKYPNDKATGYELGELRGMWKVKMNGNDKLL